MPDVISRGSLRNNTARISIITFVTKYRRAALDRRALSFIVSFSLLLLSRYYHFPFIITSSPPLPTCSGLATLLISRALRLFVSCFAASDLDCIRALFNEKEKELSLAVAKVEELTRQLEELRGRQNAVGVGAGGGGAGSLGAGLTGATGNGHLVTPASAELEKLRRELMVSSRAIDYAPRGRDRSSPRSRQQSARAGARPRSARFRERVTNRTWIQLPRVSLPGVTRNWPRARARGVSPCSSGAGLIARGSVGRENDDSP